jgi:hypothetical protein
MGLLKKPHRLKGLLKKPSEPSSAAKYEIATPIPSAAADGMDSQ